MGEAPNAESPGDDTVASGIVRRDWLSAMQGPGYADEIETMGCVANKPYGDQHDEGDEKIATGHLGLLVVGEGLTDGEARGLPGGRQAGEDGADSQDQGPDGDGFWRNGQR